MNEINNININILNSKLDFVIENFKLIKDQNNSIENRLNIIENIIIKNSEYNNNLLNEIRNVKKDTYRMDKHISFVECVITNIKNYLPKSLCNLLNLNKWDEVIHKEYIEREITHDQLYYDNFDDLKELLE
jgi:hypothetical protein